MRSRDLEDDAARRVARRFVHAEAKASDVDLLSRGQISIGCRLRLDTQPEHTALLDDDVVQQAICRMQMDRQRVRRRRARSRTPEM